MDDDGLGTGNMGLIGSVPLPVSCPMYAAAKESNGNGVVPLPPSWSGHPSAPKPDGTPVSQKLKVEVDLYVSLVSAAIVEPA